MLTIYAFLIVCPLVCLAGYIDAIAGGGGLISLPAYLIAGLSPHNAIGTNKLSSCMGTTLATARFAVRGYIPLKETAAGIVLALLGSAIGARLTLLIDSRVFTYILLCILPLTAAYALFGKGLSDKQTLKPFSPFKTALLIALFSLVIGIYDGFYGPGTGTFLMLLLTGVARLSVEKAAGVTKAINLSTNVAALAVFLSNGQTIVPLGFAAGCFSILGNYLGTRAFIKGGVKIVKPVMLGVLTILFLKIILESL